MKIAGYEIVRELGVGGMATVYLAIQPGFEREVALKVMAPNLTADKTFADRFLREAKIVAQLSHPHIVAVYDVGVDEGKHYIAMEYHPGGDLASRAREGLPVSEIVDILTQMAKALDYAHEKGYVHRDIKPGNVLFGTEDRAVLTDFGIAKAADAANAATQVDAKGASQPLTKVGSVLGTPWYMSPEQARGQPLDGRSDLYSLGIVLFELLTGHVPYQADDAVTVGIAHINDPVPTLPPEFARYQLVLSKLLAKDPDDRYQRGRDVVAALERLDYVNHDAPTELVPGGLGPLPVRRSGPPKLWVGVGAGAAVVAVGLGAALILGTGSPSEETRAPAGGSPGEVREEIAEASEPAGTPDERRVARLLTEAERALAANRLTTPVGDNAVDRFRSVLELEPDNAAAKDGLMRIAEKYVSMARRSAGRGDFANAESFLAKAESLESDVPGLESTRQLIADSRQERSDTKSLTQDLVKKMRIDGLLGGAEAAMADGNYTEPAGANALERYRGVLELDPGNRDALAGLRQLSARLIAEAEASAQAGKLDEAKRFLEFADEATPGNPAVAAARKKL